MDNAEGIIILGLIALAVALAVGIALVFWWFAGYICITFNWYKLDPNCQIITWLMFVISGGIGVGVRK